MAENHFISSKFGGNKLNNDGYIYNLHKGNDDNHSFVVTTIKNTNVWLGTPISRWQDWIHSLKACFSEIKFLVKVDVCVVQ